MIEPNADRNPSPDPNPDPSRLPMARRRFLRSAAATAGLAALAPAAWARRSGPADFLAWTETRGGVFATTNPSTGGNSLTLAARGGALLVDTKYPVYARLLARDVEAITGRPISRVVNTHHHADHVGGNLEFARTTPVVAHESGIARARNSFDRNRLGITRGSRQVARADERIQPDLAADLRRYADKIDDYGVESWKPNTSITDGVTGFDQGGVWVELHALGHRAHTDNDVVVAVPRENVLHAGDLVFNGLFPFFDPAGGGSSRGWTDALRDVEAMCDDETIVVPGHGPIADVSAVRAQIGFIESLREKVAEQLDKGTPLEEVKQMRWPFMDGLGFESIRPRGIEFVYNELKDARG